MSESPRGESAAACESRSPRSASWQRWPAPNLLAAAVLIGMALLALASMREESPTTDEPLDLSRGLAYFWGPDTSLSYVHPPLGNALQALPIVLSERRVKMAKLKGYATGEVWDVARDLFSHKYERRRAWFFEARAMGALLAVGLAYYVYRLGSRLFGVSVGLLALFFVAFHPTLIAHARLVTTDLPVTAAMLIALGELVVYLSGGSRRRGVAAALLAGAALVTKFSGLALVPIGTSFVVLAAVARLGRYRGCTRKAALASAARYLVFTGFTCLFLINVVYRFERTGLTAGEILAIEEPASGEERGFGGNALELYSILPQLPASVPIPLPYSYVFGLATLRAHAGEGHPSTFFGEQTSQGHSAYFPVMLAIKTPSLQLFGLACALYWLVRRRGRVNPAALALGVYACCFLALSMRASVNIGVRYVLPIMPALALLSALGCVRLWERVSQKAWAPRLALAAVLLHVLGMGWSFPDYLGDFNALVGGRRGGERISIIGEEWGQDTVRLGRLARAHGVSTLYFNGKPFTARYELKRQKITMQKFGCGDAPPSDAYVAISARDLARHRDDCYPWTHAVQPAFDVNNHVFVYRTPVEGRAASAR